jgi:hypothetical protein
MKIELVEAAKKIAHVEGVPTSKKLDSLRVYIDKMLSFGYTHKAIVNYLEEGGITISQRVFATYLGRRKKKPQANVKATVSPTQAKSGFRVIQHGSGSDLSRFE